MPMFLKRFFRSVYDKQQGEETTNQYCQYDSETLTMFTSSLYLAALLASLVASSVTRNFGRKRSMFFGGILFCGGALLNGFAQAVWMLIVGRIFLGFGIGFANQVTPFFLRFLYHVACGRSVVRVMRNFCLPLLRRMSCFQFYDHVSLG